MNILGKTSIVLGALLMIEASQSNLLEARGEHHGGGGFHGGGGHAGFAHGGGGHGGNWHGGGGNWHGGGGHWHGGGGGWYGYGVPLGVGVGLGVLGTTVTTTNDCWIDEYGNTVCNYDDE